MWSECLSTISPQPTVSIKWGGSSSYASSLPQVPIQWQGREVIPWKCTKILLKKSWKMYKKFWLGPLTQPCGNKLSLLWTRRQNSYHSPSWVDKQWSGGWEYICLVSTMGKGVGGEVELSRPKGPLWHLGTFSHLMLTAVSLPVIFHSRPTVNQQIVCQAHRPTLVSHTSSLW